MYILLNSLGNVLSSTTFPTHEDARSFAKRQYPLVALKIAKLNIVLEAPAPEHMWVLVDKKD